MAWLNKHLVKALVCLANTSQELDFVIGQRQMDVSGKQ